MKVIVLFILSFLGCSAVHAQYAPQAGLPGSTAIYDTSSQFTAWAAHCSVQRGYQNIADTSLGHASAGDSSFVAGIADGYIVSLGDSGVADVTFAGAIYNGPGADFAVFENGFLNATNDSLAFLELAFVEVSSDGINYTRFPATSLTQTDSQDVDPNDYLYANQLNNLAGKYIGHYGTPFDLDDVAGTPGLDVSHITHVRIIDVIGSISGHSSHDHNGHIINDPYPTPFASCGFDLDAVGVIHAVAGTSVANTANNTDVTVYPNPATDRIFISAKNTTESISATLTSVTGNVLYQNTYQQGVNEIRLGDYPAGMYYLTLCRKDGSKWVEKISKL